MKTLMRKLAWLKPFSLTALLLFGSTAGYADDTEIYFIKSKGAGNINIMFLMDTSGSMGDKPPSPAGEKRSKLQILKDVFGDLVDGMGGNINAGLAAFDKTGGANGAYVIFPIRNLDDSANKLVANSTVNSGADDGDGDITTPGALATYNVKGLIIGGQNTSVTPAAVTKGSGMIFRKLAVPSYAAIKSATLTFSSMTTLNTSVAIRGYYSVKNNLDSSDRLPDLSQQGLYIPPSGSGTGALPDRVWGPVSGTELVPVTLTNFSGNWNQGGSYTLDVTALVQKAVSDADWCGNNDMLLALVHNAVSDNYRKVGTVESANDNYPPASLSVEWDTDPYMSPLLKSCNGELGKSLSNPNDPGDKTNDAQQSGSTVTTTGSSITLKSGTNIYGGFRFPNLNYDPADTVLSAVLTLPGKGATWDQTSKACQVKVSSTWYTIGSGSYPNPDYKGDTFSTSSCGGSKKYRKCTSVYFGSCYGTTDYTTQLNDVTSTVGIPAGKNVTLQVAVVKGDAAAITTANNNLSGRTILATQNYTISASDATWNTNIPLDVTSLVQQAMNAANGWSKGAALMFRVQATAVPDNSTTAQFFVNTLEGGVGASLTLKIATADQDEFIDLHVRDQLKQAVLGLNAKGGTPTLESLTEMTRYMLGQAPYFGTSSNGTASSPDSIAGGSYISPLAPANQSCSSNHIIVMTDGASGSDTDGPTQAKNVTSNKNQVTCDSTDGGTGTNIDGRDYQCMVKLAGWMNVADNNALKRQISTDMIAFGVGTNVNYQNQHCTTTGSGKKAVTTCEFPASADPMTEMKKVTDAGGGMAKKADSADDLLQSFQSIINSVVDANATMAAPGVAVNQLNRLQYLNQLYYAVFKPKATTVWPGNMKKYGLGGTVESPIITDMNGSPAVDPNTGFFSNTAKSYWSTTIDGKEVNKGGAYEVLQKAQTNAASGTYARNLFVTTSAGSVGTTPGATSASPASLTQVTDYTSLAAEKLGLPSGATNAQRQTIMDWLMNAWGDPLHSEPQLINYGFNGGDYAAAAVDPDLQNNVVFVSENNGILHAINGGTGSEMFAFSPMEQVAQATTRQKVEADGSPTYDASKTARPIYGLDANWTFWRQANPSDPSTVKAVYAYGGQRRGGNNYYALDVTQAGFGSDNPLPKLLWQIAPASGTPFELLGQTWSQMQLAKIQLNGTDIPVLVFAGGYDDSQDTDGVVSAGDSLGHAIYIVNAYTGALIWYASSEATKKGAGSYGYTQNTDMKWSIPSAPAVVDVDGDGYADFIYVGDMHGQVFRVALDNFNNTSAANLVNSVTTIAKLGAADASDVANNRRFFSNPQVALSKRNNVDLLQLVIGSGYRAHPLSDTVQDWVYGMDDIVALPLLQAIKGGGTNSITEPVLTPSHLADVTALDAGSNVTIDDGGSGVNIYGWRVQLDQTVGEKSLSEAAILQGVAVFTTFTNAVKDVDKCTSVAGGARLYAVDLRDGLAKAGFFSGDTVTGTHGRATDINIPGIPPKPQVLLTNLPHDADYVPPADLNPLCGSLATSLTGIVGTAAVSFGSVNQCGLQRTGWYESTPAKVQAVFDKEGAQ